LTNASGYARLASYRTKGLMKMRQAIVGFTLVVSVLVTGIAFDRTNPNEIKLIKCEEDMPCWDCSTMGNKVCGPTFTEMLSETMPGPFVGWE
jgi:hypothetical protein